MAQYSHHSKISPQWRDFEAAHPELQGLDKVSFPQRRKIFEQIELSIPPRQLPVDVPEDSILVKEFSIKARDGRHDIPVRSYLSKSSNVDAKKRPLVVYLHAGGFLFGDLNSGDLNCRVLARRLDVSVLNVGYRVALETGGRFPAGLNDAYDAVEWAASNSETHLNAFPEAGFIVGGISSGANLAAVVAYQARDASLSPPITGLWLSVPVALMPQAYDLVPSEWRDQLQSLDQNAENPLLTKTSLGQIEQIYGAPASDPRISFLLNKSHEGLPRRAYFQVCGWDPLRDEAMLWQKLLFKHSGTRSKVHLYSGLPHGFWRFLSMEVSQTWLDDLVEGIEYVVRNDSDGRNTLKNGFCKEEENNEGAVVVIKG